MEWKWEQLFLKGTMRSHSDWVTAIATPIDNSNIIVTSSRDQSLILWDLTKEGKTYGVPRRHLIGHSHFVQDVVISADGNYAVSASWDSELRLWDLRTGDTVCRFTGHSKDVLSVAFSLDNRHIVSASRDRTIKLWNTQGVCMYTIHDQDAHSDWVSCVRVSPCGLRSIFVSGSWDRTVKVWINYTTNYAIKSTLTGHTGYVNTVAVSPDGTLVASGGKDGSILLWDLETGRKLYTLDAGSVVHALCFNPNRYWVCAATEASVMVWDLESKCVIDDLKVDSQQDSEMVVEETAQHTAVKNKVNHCTCLNWSADGSTLYGGYTDGIIRVWGIELC